MDSTGKRTDCARRAGSEGPQPRAGPGIARALEEAFEVVQTCLTMHQKRVWRRDNCDVGLHPGRSLQFHACRIRGAARAEWRACSLRSCRLARSAPDDREAVEQGSPIP